MLSGEIVNHGVSSEAVLASDAACEVPGSMASAMPPPMTLVATRNSRRFILRDRAMDGGAYAMVSAAAADVRHRRVDLFIRGLRVFAQQRRSCHQHARLAVAALRHIDFQPGALQRMSRIRGQTLDRRDLRAHRGLERQQAGARRRAVEVHRAGAALADAAAEFRARHPEVVAQHP